MFIQQYEINKPYYLDLRKTGEIIVGNLTKEGTLDLTIAYKAPTKKEIESISKAKVEFSVVSYESGNLLLVIRFGTLNEMDFTIDLSRYKDDSGFKRLQSLVDNINGGDDSRGVPLWITFVDTDTNLIKAMRLLGLNQIVAREIIQAFERQRSTTLAQRELELRRILQRPTKELKKFARCKQVFIK